ncbi:ribosomal L7Ae/L30e/S12e/Gadd45 family protein [Agathobaculum sp.]|uniref:ribosomal L7Ae/L30e/S12e/Gadd45 family protein n=1 Tax=Agathobaculum sp. TaxID=2048138 RepID=UPI003AF0F4C3
MANDPVLRMLGLARRAGKLAYGDELVREVCFGHKARCVFLAADAGASTAKKGAFYADKANVPCVQLPHGKTELGTSVGKSGCAIVAVTDIGLAASAVEKLASEHEEYAETAKLLSEKNARIQSRKGIKKHKEKPETAEEKPAEPEKRADARPKPTAKRPYRKPDGEKRPFRKPDGEKRPYRKPDGEKRPFRKPDGEKRPFRKADGEKRPFRKPDSEKRPFRKADGEKRPYRKPDGEKRPFRKADGEMRPYRKPDGEKRPYRKPDGEKRPFHRDGARKLRFTGEKRSFRNKT